MVMAIEADGKSYRASSSARDRDRLRKEHLERLGWTFQRLWSTNWFRDPESELAKVRAAYDEAVTSIGVPSRTGAGPTQGARGDARSSSAQGSPDGRSRSAGDVPGGGSSSAQGAPRGAGPAQAGAGGAGPAQGAPRSGSSSTQGATGAGSSPAQVGPRHPSPAEPIPGRAVALRDENAPERLSEELPSVAAAPRQAVVLRADILPEHQPHDDRHPGGMNKRLIPMTTRLAGSSRRANSARRVRHRVKSGSSSDGGCCFGWAGVFMPRRHKPLRSPATNGGGMRCGSPHS
jgi:hypothetical protein